MKKLVVITLLILLPSVVFSNSDGPPDRYAGDPPEGNTCIRCHNSFQLNDGPGLLQIAGIPEEYALQETYRLTVSIMMDSAEGRWGFEMTALDEDNNRAGTFRLVDNDVSQLSGDAPQYVKQTRNGTYAGEIQGVWQVDWIAPDEDIGEITFWVAGNAADNDDGARGDYIYTTSGVMSPPPPLDEFELQLFEGWNLVSSPVVPVDPDIRVLFEQLIEDEILFMIRDETGNFTAPSWGFWGIEEWEFDESYEITVTEDAVVLFRGRLIDPNQRYSLRNGWNWIPYTRQEEIHPAQAFELLEDADSYWVKDRNERFFIPVLEFNGLGMIHPGDGLKLNIVEMEEDSGAVLTWPEPQGNPEPPDDPPALRHFRIARSGARTSMSLLITEWGGPYMPVEGYEIGVFTDDGILVGASVITEGPIPIIAWADNEFTEEIEGFWDNDELIFLYWDAQYDEAYPPQNVETPNGRELRGLIETYMPVRITLPEPLNQVGGKPDSQPFDFRIMNVSPNPFNAHTVVTFSLDKAELVTLKAWDTTGRLLITENAGLLSIGEHSWEFNGENLPTGIYILGIETGDRRVLTRAVLLK